MPWGRGPASGESRIGSPGSPESVGGVAPGPSGASVCKSGWEVPPSVTWELVLGGSQGSQASLHLPSPPGSARLASDFSRPSEQLAAPVLTVGHSVCSLSFFCSGARISTVPSPWALVLRQDQSGSQ